MEEKLCYKKMKNYASILRPDNNDTPTLNEEKAIGSLIEEIKQQGYTNTMHINNERRQHI
ncbi:MAG: hypothetical protein N3F64_06920 [Nitrososphaeria archaeon]|nr:hypothetical protein [Nitrososphaeria archaeon]